MSRHLSPHGDLTLTRFSSGLAVFYHDLGLLELISTETDSKIGTFCNLQKMNTATTFSVQSDAHKHSTERITELSWICKFSEAGMKEQVKIFIGKKKSLPFISNLDKF